MQKLLFPLAVTLELCDVIFEFVDDAVTFPPPPELRDMSSDGNDELEDELDICEGEVRLSNEL